MPTWKEKYNKKYNHPKDASHTLTSISKDTGISKKGLQQIYNKGIGAWKTNIGSVRLKKDFSKNPNTSKYPRKSRLGKEQWAMARVYSAVMGGKASKVDAKELKMQMGGSVDNVIKCYTCTWSWKESEGGDDKYVCHKCGTDNTEKYMDYENNNFDRVDFYKGYFKNLSPSDFKVMQKGGKIQIDVPMASMHDGIDEVDAIASGVFAKGGDVKEYKYKIKALEGQVEPLGFDDIQDYLDSIGEELNATAFYNEKDGNIYTNSKDFLRVIDTDAVGYLEKGGDIGDKIRLLKREGYPQKQAVAIALDMKERGKFEKGGQTDFNPDGQIKDKIVHASGQAGGMLVGKRHSKGGIKAINKSTGQPLEMEGGEVVITRDAVSDPKKRSFNGKMMTNRQILSAINESGGGVSFADGGEVPSDLKFDCNAEYEYGGKTMCGKDLAYAMGGVTTAIVTDPNEAMSDLQSTYGFRDVFEFGGDISTDAKKKLEDLKTNNEFYYEAFLNVYENAKMYNLPLEVGKGKNKIKLNTHFLYNPRLPVNIKEDDGLKNAFSIQFGRTEAVYLGGEIVQKLFALPLKGDVIDNDGNIVAKSNIITKITVKDVVGDTFIEANNYLELVDGFSKLTYDRKEFWFYADFSDGTKDIRILSRLEGFKRQPRGWKTKYYFGYKSLIKKIVKFLSLFSKYLLVNKVNILPFLMGINEASIQNREGKESLEKQQRMEKAEKMKRQKLLDANVLNLANEFSFIHSNNIESKKEPLKEVLEELDQNLKKDLKTLSILLQNFSGSKDAEKRALITKEMSKLQEKIEQKENNFLSIAMNSTDLLTPVGLLNYYFTQTTQSPVSSLDKACKLPTPNGGKSKLPLSAYLNVRTYQFKKWFGDWELAYQTNNYNGCSIMIDEDTKEPKMYFHGVRKFTGERRHGAMGSGVTRPYGSFNPTKFNASYFADNEEYAKFYSGISENLPKSIQGEGFVYSVFLNLRNPIDLFPLGLKCSYKNIRDYLLVKYGVEIEYNNILLKLIGNDINEENYTWQYIRNDESLIELFKNYGYDGIFQKGDIPKYDKDGKLIKDRSKWIQDNEYLTLYPNQVKSVQVKRSFYMRIFDDIRFKKGGYVCI